VGEILRIMFLPPLGLAKWWELQLVGLIEVVPLLITVSA